MGTARLDIGRRVKAREGLHNILNRRIVDHSTNEDARDVDAQRCGRCAQQHQRCAAADAIGDQDLTFITVEYLASANEPLPLD